jgi:hypothetical protein
MSEYLLGGGGGVEANRCRSVRSTVLRAQNGIQNYYNKKGKFSPCASLRHNRGVEVWAALTITSAVDEGEWSASHLDHITPGIEPHVSTKQFPNKEQ